MKYLRIFFLIGIGLLVGAVVTQAALQSAVMKPLSPRAGRASVYEVRFRLTEAFPARGNIVVEFPQEFDLSQAFVAGSPNVNGGFKVFVDGRRVRIQRSGLGSPIPAGEEIIIRLANIKNPKTPGQFQAKLDVQEGKRILGTANAISFSILPARVLKPVK